MPKFENKYVDALTGHKITSYYKATSKAEPRVKNADGDMREFRRWIRNGSSDIDGLSEGWTRCIVQLRVRLNGEESSIQIPVMEYHNNMLASKKTADYIYTFHDDFTMIEADHTDKFALEPVSDGVVLGKYLEAVGLSKHIHFPEGKAEILTVESLWRNDYIEYLTGKEYHIHIPIYAYKDSLIPFLTNFEYYVVGEGKTKLTHNAFGNSWSSKLQIKTLDSTFIEEETDETYDYIELEVLA
tara:strand:- start:3429 stop:4154 length:726 start_codon:yes stop_codon:yes gene_type:complete